MPTFNFKGFSASAFTFGSGTVQLDPDWDAQNDGFDFEITDDDTDFQGDSGTNETSDDASQQTAVVRDETGSVTASGPAYLEEAYVLTDGQGTTIRLYRVEINGTHVGYVADGELQPGSAYSLTTTDNVTNANAPAYTDIEDVSYDQDTANTITGSSNDDTLNGGAGADTIAGAAGADSIDGGANADSIDGGSGDDSITGGDGDDTITGGSGGVRDEDTLTGGSTSGSIEVDNETTNYTATASAGGVIGSGPYSYGDITDGYRLFFNNSNDDTFTFAFDQTLDGVILNLNGFGVSATSDITINGNDVNLNTLIANGDVSILETGSVIVNGSGDLARDSAVANSEQTSFLFNVPIDSLELRMALSSGSSSSIVAEVIALGQENTSGDDTIDGGLGADVIDGEEGDDSLAGGAGDDTISGGAGADSVNGDGGDDSVLVEDNFGADTVAGGETAETTGDTLDFSAVTSGVTIDFTGPEAGTATDGTDTLTFSEFENYTLTAQDDYVDGWQANSSLNIDGGAGADEFLGSRAGDTLTGGAGTDTISAGGGADSVSGGTESDTLVGGSGQDTIDGGDGADNIRGDNVWLNTNEFTSAGGAAATLTVTNSAEGPIELWQIDGTGTLVFIDTINAGDTLNHSTGADDNFVLRDPVGFYLQLIEGGNQTVDYGADGLGDSIVGGAGADTIYGEFGDDTIDGGDDNDSILGGFGDDRILGGDGADTIAGGAGDDTLIGQNGDDSLSGGTGEDVFRGGIGNNTLEGGDDADIFHIGIGTDTIVGGEGGNDRDTVSIAGADDAITVTYAGDEQGTFSDNDGDGGAFSEVEVWELSSEADSVDATADSAGIEVDAGDGADTLRGGSGADSIAGGDGGDLIYGGGGSDTLDGGQGADTIYGHTNTTTLTGGAGDDQIFASSAGSDVDAGADNDTVFGSISDDTIDAGSGDDSVIMGGGDDAVTGGDGDDTFVYSTGHDTISDFNTGNSGALDDGDSTNNDFIDLSGHYDHISELYADQADDGVLNQSNTTDTRGQTVDYSDNSQFGNDDSLTFQGASANSSSFSSENTGVVCFTAGTAIRTPGGDVLIEDLKVGDLVTTLDNGPQRLRWIGRRALGQAELAANPNLRPVLIRRGLLGAERDLLVSPQHGMLMPDETLIRAKFLAEAKGNPVRVAHGRRSVVYFHLLFDAHQVIFAENTRSESLYPGPMAMQAMAGSAQAELATIFPELRAAKRQNPLSWYGDTARHYLKRKESLRNDGRIAL